TRHLQAAGLVVLTDRSVFDTITKLDFDFHLSGFIKHLLIAHHFAILKIHETAQTSAFVIEFGRTVFLSISELRLTFQLSTLMVVFRNSIFQPILHRAFALDDSRGVILPASTVERSVGKG